ncbi:MAG: hypothetical protein LBV79_02140 [Candidatus Adiutrix sp.]|jgi:hypothetical protein|nr:hypothetical protein [Candidatus Adiutrix sp.]
MAKAAVIIFTPGEEEKRALDETLAETEFDSFTPRVLAAGSGRERGKAAVTAALAPLAEASKPLMLIGAGPCRPLAGGLKPGEAAASASVLATTGAEKGRLVESAAPLTRAVLDRLAAKGFRPGALLEDSPGAAPANCLAADTESAGIALAATEISPDIPWLNLRLAPEIFGQSPEEYLEALGLKLLVTLSTLDRTPPPSACSGCRNPCGIFK